MAVDPYCEFSSNHYQSDVSIYRSAPDYGIRIDVAPFRPDTLAAIHDPLAGQSFAADDATHALDILSRLTRHGFRVPKHALKLLDEESHLGRAHDRCCARHKHHVNPHQNCILR